jgi:Zn-finger nucleic acid-binding protein
MLKEGEFKFNNGRGAVICPECFTIASTGTKAQHDTLDCPKCNLVFVDPRDLNYN